MNYAEIALGVMDVRVSARAATRRVAGIALMLSFGYGCAISEPVDEGDGKGGAAGLGGATAKGGAGSGGAATVFGGTTSAGGATGTGGASSGGASSGGATAKGGASSGGAASGGAKSTGGAGGAVAGGGSGGGAGKAQGGAAGSSGNGGGSTAGGSGCDWTSASCTSKTCAAQCPTNDGGSCASQCNGIITCIQANPGCGTATNPMCVTRGVNTGTASVCTQPWEQAGGGSTPPGVPARNATSYFNCACGMSVGVGGGTGSGGASSGGSGGAGGGAGGKSSGGAGGKG